MISQEIKDKLDIVEVIGDYIKLKKSGANYTAICPFHQEKTASFFVSPSKQIWHCFGSCSEGGDIFKFVMKIEGIEYVDALRILASKAGVKLKKPDKETILRESEKEILYDVCEKASLFFEKQLESSKGKMVLNYLFKRKVNQESIKKWRIGYGSDAWQGLFDFLINSGYKAEDIEKAGLVIKKETGGYFDRFRQRIIFPIFDLNSRIIGFSGRIFDLISGSSQTAKYINSPTTVLYDKSKTLYGLDQAKIEIRKKDYCILVEGYLDVILLSQAGFKNVIAISGTALTIDHLRIIGRYTKNIYLSFDTDIAGESATKKGIEMILKVMEDFNIKIIILPEELDPADVIEKSLDFQKYINSAKSIIAYYFDIAFQNFNIQECKIEDKKKILKELLPIIKKIPNKIEQSYWLQELTIRLNTKESILVQEMEKIKNFNDVKNEHYSDSIEVVKKISKNRKELLEERIIILVLLFNEFIDLIDLSLNFSDFFIEIIKLIKEKKNIVAIQKKIKKSSDLDFFNYLLIKSENSLIEKDDAEEEIKMCLGEIKKIKLKEKREEVIKKIRELEQQKNGNGNKKEIEKLIEELQNLN